MKDDRETMFEYEQRCIERNLLEGKENEFPYAFFNLVYEKYVADRARPEDKRNPMLERLLKTMLGIK